MASSEQASVAGEDSVLGIVRICSGLAYETLKTRLVSYHCTRMGFTDCLNHSRSELVIHRLQAVYSTQLNSTSIYGRRC